MAKIPALSVMPTRLLVGLGNPGKQYAHTRHNVGASFVTRFVIGCGLSLRPDALFKGFCSRLKEDGIDCYVLIPSTYMNCCGSVVRAMVDYYKLSPQSIVVAHDDLDLPVGVVRLYFNGGHGGHNGVRDIIANLGTSAFARMRIGISHPGGDRSAVSSYVLSEPTLAETISLHNAMRLLSDTMPLVLQGEWIKAVSYVERQQQTSF